MTKLGRKLKKNPQSPIGKPISSERAREVSLMRRTFAPGPGRPKSDERCFCGEMTLSRALKRGHDCDEPELVERREKGLEA